MRDLLVAVIRNPAAAQWESWLALLAAALGDEAALVAALESLDLDEQQALHLALQDGGVYTDALQVLVARHADVLADDQVREFLLADASESAGRLSDWLVAHRDDLVARIGQATARDDAAFDLAREVATLEARLAELRASQVGDRFREKHDLDAEIHRLEVFARQLGSYDGAARRTHLEQLEAETRTLRADRDSLESKIEAAIGARDDLRRDHAELLERHAETAHQRDEISRRVIDLSLELEAADRALAKIAMQLAAPPRDAAEPQGLTR